jgi:hypothetical protein
MMVFTIVARRCNWFGNPAIVLEQEIRGFATPPRGGCAVVARRCLVGTEISIVPVRASADLT